MEGTFVIIQVAGKKCQKRNSEKHQDKMSQKSKNQRGKKDTYS